jgi:hypothetical protein
MSVENGRLVARCRGGGALAVIDLEVDGEPLSAKDFAARHGASQGAAGIPLGGSGL